MSCTVPCVCSISSKEKSFMVPSQAIDTAEWIANGLQLDIRTNMRRWRDGFICGLCPMSELISEQRILWHLLLVSFGSVCYAGHSYAASLRSIPLRRSAPSSPTSPIIWQMIWGLGFCGGERGPKLPHATPAATPMQHSEPRRIPRVSGSWTWPLKFTGPPRKCPSAKRSSSP